MQAQTVYRGRNILPRMLRIPVPAPPKEPAPSICSDWGRNKLFWVVNDDAKTLDDAWDCYVSDQFGSGEQAGDNRLAGHAGGERRERAGDGADAEQRACLHSDP